MYSNRKLRDRVVALEKEVTNLRENYGRLMVKHTGLKKFFTDEIEILRKQIDDKKWVHRK